MTLDVEIDTRDALRKALDFQVDDRVKFVSQQCKFKWSLLVDPESDAWLRRACLTRKVVDGVELWIIVEDDYRGQDGRCILVTYFRRSAPSALKTTHVKPWS